MLRNFMLATVLALVLGGCVSPVASNCDQDSDDGVIQITCDGVTSTNGD